MSKGRNPVNRNQKAVRDAKMKNEMDKPINKFLNLKNENGEPKYEIAKDLIAYYTASPDIAMNSIRLTNSLLHELRWHMDQSKKYLANYESKDKIEMFDQNGIQLTREQCYTSYIKEQQVCYTVLSKLRSYIVEVLLVTVDDQIFTFEQYNNYIIKVKNIVESLGFEMFPKTVKVIEPL